MMQSTFIALKVEAIHSHNLIKDIIYSKEGCKLRHVKLKFVIASLQRKRFIVNERLEMFSGSVYVFRSQISACLQQYTIFQEYFFFVPFLNVSIFSFYLLHCITGAQQYLEFFIYCIYMVIFYK